ncbi:MAG TPA: winged helix-turn-helix domain-containing protein [Steroidobacteraceae bacterium]
MNSSREIRFDGWTLNRATGELTDGHVRTRLRPQPLLILEELLAHPGELVMREQLIARLWPGRIVEFDTGLNSAVRKLRATLGDHPDAPRYIETIPRRGYRFIGQVEARQPGDPPMANVAVAVPARRWGRRTVAAAASILLLLGTAAAVQLTQRDAILSAVNTVRVAPDPQAQEHYDRARYFLQRRAPGDVERARRYFTEATALRPDFARAWAGLASAYWLDTGEGRLPPEQGLAGLLESATRALSIDPTVAEAHVRLAAYRWRTGDHRSGDAHLRRAFELEPANPLVLSVMAGRAASRGRFEAAIELERKAVLSDPLTLASRGNLVTWLTLAGHLREAEAELRRLLELRPGRGEDAGMLAQLLVMQGRFGEALELTGSLNDEGDRLLIRTIAFHGLGRDAESDAALQSLIALAPAGDPVRIAEAHAYRGDTDEAFHWMSTEAVDCEQARIRYSPLLQALRSDPRWPTQMGSTGQMLSGNGTEFRERG